MALKTMDTKRIVIGIRGNQDMFHELRKIIRKTTYGMELDFYNLPSNYEIPETKEEIFRIDTRDIQPCACLHDVPNILKLIQEERFWECHEIMEVRWRKLHGEERERMHMIIRLMVSQVKWQMSQFEVSVRVLKETLDKLETLVPWSKDQLIIDVSYPLKPGNKFILLLDQLYIN